MFDYYKQTLKYSYPILPFQLKHFKFATMVDGDGRIFSSQDD